MNKEVVKPKRAALGKGMSALLGQNASPDFINTESKNRMVDSSGPLLVAISSVKTAKDQPRKIFKTQDLQELSQSIKENGIIQPLTVTVGEDGGYNLIAGERRLRAAKAAGLTKVPVVVKNYNKEQASIVALVENVQRSDLNCVEEALAYYQLMNQFEFTQEDLSNKVGKDRSSIANALRILKLPRDVIGLLQQESLSFGHAKVLGSLKEASICSELAASAAKENWSIRELERQIKQNSGRRPSNNDKLAKPSVISDREIKTLTERIEQKSGFQVKITANASGRGQISLKFTTKDQLDDLFEYLMSRK